MEGGNPWPALSMFAFERKLEGGDQLVFWRDEEQRLICALRPAQNGDEPQPDMVLRKNEATPDLVGLNDAMFRAVVWMLVEVVAATSYLTFEARDAPEGTYVFHYYALERVF